MNFDNISQPWSMVRPSNTRLPVNPDHPFIYKHFPANWEFSYISVSSGKKIKQVPVYLPSVEMERIVPGVNGVHQIQGELGDNSARLGKLQQQGYIILDPERHDYMRVYPAKYGGSKHSPKWENFKILAGQVISKFDRAAWNQWRIQLMIDGTIPLPHDHFLELDIMAKKRLPQRYISQQHIPEIKSKLDGQYSRIADMETARRGVLDLGIEYYKELIHVDQ